MATHSSILAWKIPGQKSQVTYSPWGRKELETTEHTQQHNSKNLPQHLCFQSLEHDEYKDKILLCLYQAL